MVWLDPDVFRRYMGLHVYMKTTALTTGITDEDFMVSPILYFAKRIISQKIIFS